MKIISNINEIPANQRVVVYGSGEFAKLLINILQYSRPDINIPFICDSYKTGQLNGIDIILPQSIQERENEYDFILIASTYVEQIASILGDLKISNVKMASKTLISQGIVIDNINIQGYARYRSILIELTTRCNMGCDFCGRSIRTRPLNHDMDFDLFKHIVDQISLLNLTNTVHLYGNGEPLLAPNLSDAIRYCKQKNLQTVILTNGLLLTTDRYEKLLESGLDHLYISFHNLSESAFKYRRASGKINYSLYYDKMLEVVSYHVREEIKTPLTLFLMFSKKEWITSRIWDLNALVHDTDQALDLMVPFFLSMQKIASENHIECYLNIDNFKEVLYNMKVDNMHDIQEINIMGNVNLKFDTLIPLSYNEMKLIKGDHLKGFRLRKNTTGFCSIIQTLYILSDGLVIPCCRSSQLKEDCDTLSIGKITEDQSLGSILKSEKYQKMLQGFRQQKIVLPVCQKCMGEYEEA